MKKCLSLILAAALLLGVCSALGEAVNTPYEALAALMDGKSFTLTIRAEDVDGLEDYMASFGGTITCSLRQEGESILLTAASAGDAYLNAAADVSGYQVETNLLENGKFAGTWAELAANATLTDGDGEKGLSVRFTTADHAIISFHFSVTGTDADDYEVDSGLSVMNPDGTFCSFFDTVTASGGETTRESLISIVSPEWTIEGEGVETAQQGEQTILTRRESCAVSLDYEEIGSLTLISELVIAE